MEIFLVLNIFGKYNFLRILYYCVNKFICFLFESKYWYMERKGMLIRGKVCER